MSAQVPVTVRPSVPHSPAAPPRRHRAIPPLTAAILTLLVAGCGDKGEPPASATPAPSTVASAPAAPSVCKADASWISNPNPPSEVAPEESFCDFYQFSWQWFLAQVAPAPDYAQSGHRMFETNRLHDPAVQSGQCSLEKIMGRAMAAQKLALRVNKPQGFEEEQADGNALYDQHGNLLRYNIWYSDAECQSTQDGFAAGTFEIKISWKILDNPDTSYYTMPANIGGQDVTVGLVGFHIANWTSKHPEMIWATFEHKTNAPLCDGSSPMPASGWSLASNDAANCLTQNPVPPGMPPSTACAAFGFNTPDAFTGSAPPSTDTPNNVCRMFAHGNQTGESINGNDNASNLLAIQQLNAELVGPDGLLTKLPDTDPMAVWKHYELIGGIWTKGGTDSGNPPVPYTDNGKVMPGDPASTQRGSLQLTNMTMETFEQGDTSQVPNCFGCHGFSTSDPLDVSHICTSLFETKPGTQFTCMIPGSAAPDAKAMGEAMKTAGKDDHGAAQAGGAR